MDDQSHGPDQSDNPDHAADGRPAGRTPLVAALTALSEALDDTDPRCLPDTFDTLVHSLDAVIESLSAVSLTVTVGDHPFVVTSVIPSAEPVVTTLSIPLPVSATATCVLILGASTARAFTDLAHEAASTMGAAAGIERDRHLHWFSAHPTSNLDDRSTIDQAIGMLMERDGYGTVAAARDALTTRAMAAERTPLAEARAIVETQTDTRPPRAR